MCGKARSPEQFGFLVSSAGRRDNAEYGWRAADDEATPGWDLRMRTVSPQHTSHTGGRAEVHSGAGQLS